MDDDGFLQETLGAMDLVYNIARRMVPRREDAEDLVQETYLAAYRAWQDRRRPRRVEPWMATICLNLARSSYRSRSRRPVELPWPESASFPSPDDTAGAAIAAAERDAVHRALWDLSEEHRLAISLVDLAGFSTKEAARILRIPRGTVLSRLHRGRKALAAVLEEQGFRRDQAEERDR